MIGRLGGGKTRIVEGRFLVEGIRGVREVLQSRLVVELLVVDREVLGKGSLDDFVTGFEARSAPVEAVEGKVFRDLSATEHPQGVLAVCREPRTVLTDWDTSAPGGYLLLDGIQDPGNVGTLVRSARAFGLRGVVALEGTSDPWNAKAVRASAGASLHRPPVTSTWADALAWARKAGMRVWVADASGADVSTLEPGRTWVLVVGNEGAGVSEIIRHEADGSVGVPMTGGADSLNAGVAGAVLMYALTRREHGA